MSIDKIRTQVISQIWQAIARSNVDLSQVLQEDQENMVRKIADSMLLFYDSLIQKETQEELERIRDEQEKTLADYYHGRLRYWDFHTVKNVSE